MGVGMGFGMGAGIGAAFNSQISNMANTVMGASSPSSSPTPPPPPGSPQAVSFHLSINGQQYGPYDMNSLAQMAANRQLTPDTYVWLRVWHNGCRLHNVRNSHLSLPLLRPRHLLSHLQYLQLHDHEQQQYNQSDFRCFGTDCNYCSHNRIVLHVSTGRTGYAFLGKSCILSCFGDHFVGLHYMAAFSWRFSGSEMDVWCIQRHICMHRIGMDAYLQYFAMALGFN